MSKICLVLVVVFVIVSVILVSVFQKEKNPIIYLTAALVVITAYYAWATHEQLKQSGESVRRAIRPLIIATRLSKEGEIGAFAAEEGINRLIHLVNVGSGHAHRVNIRIDPPTGASATDKDRGIASHERAIYVIHGMEMPKNSKRIWNELGSFCSPDRWHYMYAEYEDTEGNQYYTIQSGYNVKTGRIGELNQNRKDDNDPFWEDRKRENWLDEINNTLKEWAQKQRETFERRTKKTLPVDKNQST